MAVPDAIRTLVERFEFHRQAYIVGKDKFNETQLRREFIDKFFATLGWDVENNKGFSEAYKEVLHEEPVRIRGTTQFFDYTFRIGGTRKFIVETKRPSVKIKDDADAALQLRWYAWNAKLPLSILTNFEEFAVYDCTRKPLTTDNAAAARIEYFTFKEYPEKWDWITSIFAQESILKGSFDRYAESTKGKRGTTGVDDDFLAEIEDWRDSLAKNIALRNTQLTVEELNSVVQRTIDRIIFLRICEDRAIEKYGTLQKLLEGDHVYERLGTSFRNADAKYNSGVFHFRTEPGWDEPPDNLSLTLAIDDKVLKSIIKRLYYPESPYIFSVIPPAILGHVYEQFLGKVIRLTEGHQAKVEYKPEVKKAGGVFYTPQYIVDYIVKHTVGELVKGKTPREVAKLRILDPACGSGSFLLGAYQYLLDWHRDWYITNLVPVFKEKGSATDPAVLALLPESLPKTKMGAAQADLPIYKSADSDRSRVRSDWNLTTIEKKRILLNNIFGVDIDQQAVEVTKLALLLKVLEEENEENIDKQLKLFEERVLPSLHNNIKCGNSLIGIDVYADVQTTLDHSEEKRINAFDWGSEFTEIMKAGGFDVVIGNPPYIRIQIMKEWAPKEAEYFKNKYLTASKGNYDIYVVFVEKGISLLNKDGLLGFILPHKFFTAQYGEPLRSLISNGKYVKEIVHFGHQQIFPGVTTYTNLLFLGKTQNPTFHFIKVDDLETWRTSGSAHEGVISSNDIGSSDWNLLVGSGKSIFEKLKKMDFVLKNIAHIFVGTQTSAEDIFVLQNCKIRNNLVVGYSKADQKEISIEKEITKWFLKGRQIRRYEPPSTDYGLICPYKITENDFQLFTKDELISIFPLAFEYFSRHKKFLTDREKGRFEEKDWWAFGYPKSMILFQKPKIICPNFHITAAYSFDTNGHFFKTGYGILVEDPQLSYQYVLGLLNSKLLFWFYQRICSVMREGYSSYMTQYIEQIPIRKINFSNPAEVAHHDRMAVMVSQILDLNKRIQEATLEHEKTLLQRQVDAIDAQIDKLVYELYGLRQEEIDIVEGKKPIG